MHRESMVLAGFGSVFAAKIFSFYLNDCDFLDTYERLQGIYCDLTHPVLPGDHPIAFAGLGCSFFNLQPNQGLCDAFKTMMDNPASTQANFCDVLTEHHTYFEQAASSSLTAFAAWLVFMSVLTLYMEGQLDNIIENIAARLNAGRVAAG